MAVTLILADDHPMTRAGLVYWFARGTDFRLLAEASDGEEAWRAIETHEPDVALIDIEMPKENGILVTQKIKRARLRTAVLMLTSYRAQQYVLASLRAGASGFILKTTSLEELEKAIMAASKGCFYLDPKISRPSASSVKENLLSHREKEILALTAQGFSGKDLAEMLDISERTVEAHLGAVYNKFGAKNKTEAVLMALKNGIILLEELTLREGKE
ncbi:MAG: response regulator transcription factor [Synergistaceae bacterium]|jgi:DNA-binding NarL/FixJ family response regulator|nr:response regulator transcription factor [Synergistaceae bacterium]